MTNFFNDPNKTSTQVISLLFILFTISFLFILFLHYCNKEQQSELTKQAMEKQKEPTIETFMSEGKKRKNLKVISEKNFLKASELQEKLKNLAKTNPMADSMLKSMSNPSFIQAMLDSKDKYYKPPKETCSIDRENFSWNSDGYIDSEPKIRAMLYAIIRRSLCAEYRNYLQIEHNLEGKIILKFTIKNDSVANAIILSSTTNNQEFDEKIKNEIKSYKWEMKDKRAFTVTVPLIFEQRKNPTTEIVAPSAVRNGKKE